MNRAERRRCGAHSKRHVQDDDLLSLVDQAMPRVQEQIEDAESRGWTRQDFVAVIVHPQHAAVPLLAQVDNVMGMNTRLRSGAHLALFLRKFAIDLARDIDPALAAHIERPPERRGALWCVVLRRHKNDAFPVGWTYDEAINARGGTA